ncbi:MAG: GNAT family N-acetyltransferase [Anaerolineales bacterium]|nr:GNAT family N-acetyltransferase [Anaerolineales bacterium]
MKTIILRPAEPERDFRQLAVWFSILEDDASSEQGLKEYYEKRRELIIQRVAEDDQGELLGFYWTHRNSTELCHIDLFVKPEQRRQGVGRRLYEDLEQSVKDAQAKKLHVSVLDTSSESRAFAERRGFSERWHFIPMRLNLETFDDQAYEEIIAKLKGEGFQFTSMEELGNTEETQRKLYILNDTTDLDVPGKNGEHTWNSFDDFQKRVCQMDWYKPGGQMVAIDTATGDWAAMSAISRFENHAYNLHTGVDRRYRGRKLAQAVKVLALRYARDVLKVNTVHTDHNTMNQAMLAIDRKLGYVEMPGTFVMRKILE